MKFDWIEILLGVFGLFIAYQILRFIFGGGWQMESLIIALLVTGFGLLWKINISILKLENKFDRHISWHKIKDEK